MITQEIEMRHSHRRSRSVLGVRDDRGIAMLTTILVLVIIAGIGAVTVSLATRNLSDSGADRLEGEAIGNSEAGIAAGIEYMRGGVSQLNACLPGGCASLDWTQPGTGHKVCLDTACSHYYRVWITVSTNSAGVTTPFNPPTNKTGYYLVHSQGYAGSGPGLHEVTEKVTVNPLKYPVGVYADSIDSTGSGGVHHESIFTAGCISGRSHISFDVDPTSPGDPYYGLYPGVHSTDYISTNMHNCSSSIHDGGSTCNASYPHDQDAAGGPISVADSSTCKIKPGAAAGSETSKFTTQDLQQYIDPSAQHGLTEDEYQALKQRAIVQGQYYPVGSTPFSNPIDSTAYPNGVIYIETTGTVTLQNNLNAAYGPGDGAGSVCGSKSVMLIVRGGNLHVNAGSDFVGSIFVPEGQYWGNGTSRIEGTVYAQTMNINGTTDFWLDPCWVSNMPGGVVVSPQRFTEQYGGPAAP